MVEVKNLNLSFNKEYKILNNVNVTIKKGEKVAFVGKSGSGKTCLLRSIVGLEELQEGEVYINNISIKNINFKSDCSVGYVPKTPVLLEKKTVKQNLEYVLHNRNVDSASINFKILNSLKTFDIESIRNFQVKDLSKYHRQVVQLARVSQRKIELFVIDEIIDKLSPTEQKNIMNYFKILLESFNSTFIFSFTDEKFAQELGLKIIRIENGSIID